MIRALFYSLATHMDFLDEQLYTKGSNLIDYRSVLRFCSQQEAVPFSAGCITSRDQYAGCIY
jgi:hypothetical protein